MREVDLSAMDAQQEGVAQVIASVAECKSLTVLSMMTYSAGKAGVAALTVAMRGWTALARLELAGAGCFRPGVCRGCCAREGARVLLLVQSLDLSFLLFAPLAS